MDKDNESDAESDRCEQLDVHLSSDDGDIFQDEESDHPLDLEWLKKISEEDDDESDADLAVAARDTKKRSCAETARMFKLRRNLDQLDCSHRQKEHDVLKAREKLKLCRQNVESLLEQRENLEKEIERQKATDNVVAVFRLRSQHKHLCQKLQSEEELEGHVNSELKLRELELSEVEVELGRVSSLRQELQQEEQLRQVLKAQKAAMRLQHERKASQNLQLKIQHLRNKQAAMLKEEETECQRKIDEARASRKIAAKYLKQTVKRMHQEEAEEERQNRELVEKRIQAVKSLKSNIAATQESLKVQQSRAKANAQKKEQQQRQLRESLQAQGINSIKHMHQQKQLAETKRKQEEFEETQKSKRVETVAKILQEEQQMKSRKKSPALTSKPSAADSLSARRSARETPLCRQDPVPPTASEERATIQLRELGDTSSSSSASSDNEDLEEMRESPQQDVDHQSLADSLAEPEFSGLWDQDFKNILHDKLDLVQEKVLQEEPPVASGKLDKAPKKVQGKELKKPSFVSKPEVLVFKDFEVGKMYKKKIVLTNISFTINHCKLLGISTQLKDFISVNFEPPGSLSSGMSFDIQAIFQPKINEDLEGEIQFASAVGSFSVPVRCTIKKCMPEVDVQLIDFGSHVVGQTITRTITLTNKGALATLFSLDMSAFLSPETSHVQLPHKTCASTCQDASSQIFPNNQESFASLDGREVQPKQTSEEPSVALQQEQAVSDVSAAGTEAEPGSGQLSHVDPQIDETTSDDSDIKLGNVREGEIGPFESISLELIFTPTIPVETKLDFHIKFSDKTCKPIPIQARGVAVSVPVWVVQTSIDLKICMFDRLYQDTIMVQSRASTALKVTFEVCPEMRKHMEIVPKMGFIQAQSGFNAQLKFMPRRSLAEDAKEFFDSDVGVLEVPMTVQVAGQVQPAHFTVHAVVTSTDLQFDDTVVDFGFCSVYESVKKSVRLTNLSLLPQDFGFLGVPEFVEVQPNDGFGTLLPQETLELHLIFSPRSAKEYNFQLKCKSGINRDFLLSCRAIGIHPPLQLSHSVVQFGATAVGDHSIALLHLIYHHTDPSQQSKQAACPLDRDAPAPAVPRLFCFAVPADSDLSVTPAAGRLLPGEKCLVQVKFRPRLLEQEIKDEALRLLHLAKLHREKELERLAEQEAKKDTPVEAGKGKKIPVNAKGCKTAGDPKTEKLPESPVSVDIQPGSEQYEKARTSLLYSFRKRYREHTVPCFVSDSDPPEEDRQVQPAWSPSNTIYLKLQCPAVQPPLVVLSNNERNVVDFRQVVIGEKVIQKLTVQNISKEPLDLMSSVLDVRGPFTLLNALRRIRPGEKHTLVLAFNPTLEKKYGEVLEVHSQGMTVVLTLRGEGVVPAVTSSHTDGPLDFGYVLEKESTTQVVKLQNSSVVTVGFRALLASLSPFRPQGGTDQLALLLDRHTDSQLHPTIGTQNYSGLSVFSVVPAEGSIAPGASQDIVVSFQPDHQSVNYCDKLTIELMNKTTVCEMDLKGAASSHNMCLYGGDLLTVPIESLLPSNLTSSLQPTESEVMERPSIPLLVTLQACCSSDTVPAAVRELQVGCIRSTQTGKKSGEFYWDSLTSLQQQGFSVEPSKGSVEAGHTRTITIKWSPCSGYKPYEVVQACVPLTVKGDETTVYRVTLMALVSVTAD